MPRFRFFAKNQKILILLYHIKIANAISKLSLLKNEFPSEATEIYLPTSPEANNNSGKPTITRAQRDHNSAEGGQNSPPKQQTSPRKR